jgi:CelD/BcsL family acetyltransferase involved in cellulose biosynthesis
VDAYLRINTGTWVLLVVRMADQLVAVLPLIERRVRLSRLPLTVLRAPSDFHLWPFDIPVAPEVDRSAVAGALWDLVRVSRGWQVLELPNIPTEGLGEAVCDRARESGLPTHRWEYMHSPVVPLEGRPAVGDPLELARSAHLRHNLKGALRRIEQEGGMRVVVDQHARREVLDRFLELEASGWKGRQGNAIAARDKDVRFWSAVSTAAAQGGYLHLCTIEVRGRVVAVSLGFVYKDAFHAWKMGWDESLKRLSLGHILVRSIVGDCAARGVRAVHLGGLRSPWKQQWTDQVVPHATHYVFRRGLYGRIARMAVLRNADRLVAAGPGNREYLEGNPRGAVNQDR